MNYFKISVCILLLLLSCINVMASIENGQNAPDFKGADQKGNAISLITYEKSNLLLCFIKYCDNPIKKDIVFLNNFKNNTPQAFFNILLITSNEDCYSKVISYLEEEKINVPIIMDSDKKIQNDYKIENQFPTFYIINKNSKIACSKITFSEPMDKFLGQFMKEQKIDMKYTPKESGKPWLGLLIIEIPKHLKNFYNIENGLHIGKVIPNSPAQNAGFRPGDVIIKFDGVSVISEDEIKDIMEKKKAGDAVEVNFIRLKPVNMELNFQIKDKFNSMGWKIDELPESLQEIYNSKHGLIIENISSDSTAARLGLKPFDLIVSANQEYTDDKDGFKKLIDSKPAGSQIKLSIVRLTGETMQTKIIIGIK